MLWHIGIKRKNKDKGYTVPLPSTLFPPHHKILVTPIDINK